MFKLYVPVGDPVIVTSFVPELKEILVTPVKLITEKFCLCISTTVKIDHSLPYKVKGYLYAPDVRVRVDSVDCRMRRYPCIIHYIYYSAVVNTFFV